VTDAQTWGDQECRGSTTGKGKRLKYSVRRSLHTWHNHHYGQLGCGISPEVLESAGPIPHSGNNSSNPGWAEDPAGFIVPLSSSHFVYEAGIVFRGLTIGIASKPLSQELAECTFLGLADTLILSRLGYGSNLARSPCGKLSCLVDASNVRQSASKP
jgi:hypothetical protein